MVKEDSRSFEGGELMRDYNLDGGIMEAYAETYRKYDAGHVVE